MHGVALLLAAAAAGFVAARWLGLPPLPLLLLAGVGLGLVHPPETAVLQDALLLGAALLLFVSGMELDPGRMRAQRRAALRVGGAQFAGLAVAGFATAGLLGFAAVEAAYLALALTASSTLVCVRLLARRQQMFEPFGRLVLGVLLLQDVLVLLAIPLVSELGAPWGDALRSLGGVLVLGGASLAVRRWGAPLLLRVRDEEEMLVLGSLAILFLFVGAASALELPLVVGAFAAGYGLARFPVRQIVRVELAPVGDFFTALFFVALGALVGIPTPGQLLQAGALALVVVVVTPPLVAAVAEREGFTVRSALEAGLMLSQTSEISLVIGLGGMVAGHIGGDVFSVIALVTMGTMLLTPAISTDDAAWRLTHLHPSRWGTPPATEHPGGHVVLLGCGSTAMPLAEMLLLAGRDVAVVDEDPAVLDRLEGTPFRLVRGDASDPRILDRAGVDEAAVVVSTVRRPRDNAALLDRVGDEIPVLVRVFEEADARWVRQMGGAPVLYPEAAADALLEWYEEVREELDARLTDRAAAGGDGTPRRPGRS